MFIYRPVDGHLGHDHFGVLMNDVNVKIYVHVHEYAFLHVLHVFLDLLWHVFTSWDFNTETQMSPL